MVNHIFSTVEVKIIGQIIVLSSTRSIKANCMTNLKMNKKKRMMMVTRLRSNRWPYIKSMVTQTNKTVTMSATNKKQSNQIIFI